MKNIKEVLEENQYGCKALKLLKVDENEPDKMRFNVVTDSIEANSLLGGVATALILSTLLCLKYNWKLRIITRTAVCDPSDYRKFMSLQNLKIPDEVEYVTDVQVGERKSPRIEVSNSDIFMATSWWSAKSLLKSPYIKQIFYIIQEEETFFYSYGDMHLWCKEIINDGRISFIVNTKLLFDYFKTEGCYNIINNSCWFEPAFSSDIYYPDEDTFKAKRKYKLFFYGRPNNSRNLFYHGIDYINEAIERNIINTEKWDIYMGGGDYPDFYFSNGYTPIMKGRMSWKEYANFSRTIDLAFSLMYTPHPSYPPFDMLSSGAVVLTNNFANKKELNYSENLVMEDLKLEDMMEGFEKAIQLAENIEVRKKNYKSNTILRKWDDAFDSSIEYISKKIEGGMECIV